MKRRQFLLSTLALPLADGARAQDPLTDEQRQRLSALLGGGLARALQALPVSQLPRTGLWMVVDLPREPNREPSALLQAALQRLAVSPTVEDLTLYYNCQKTRLGNLVTFVPTTMHVLSADKRLARELSLAELARSNPLTLLLGSLSDAQFARLLSDGIGFGDLDAAQAQLLNAALPATLIAEPTAGRPGDGNRALPPEERARQWQEYSKKRRTYTPREVQQGLRLRTFLHTSYSFSVPDVQGYGIGLRPSDDNQDWAGRSWQLEGGGYRPNAAGEALASYFVRAVPNQLKRGGLAWTTEALGAPVALDGVKTVLDVVQRVSAATHLELFVDPRFGRKSVTLFGDSGRPTLARDLVRALAFALAGTWRKVGPGYVLTHDLVGRAQVAARQKEIVDVWSRRLTEAAVLAGKRLAQIDWRKNIPFAPGDLSAPPRALMNQKVVTWDELPPRLQLAFDLQFEKYSKPPERVEGETEEQADARMGGFHRSVQKVNEARNGKTVVDLSAELQFAIEMPETGPMALGEAKRIPEDSWYTPPPESPTLAPTPIAPMVLTEPTRALLVPAFHPDQAEQVVAQAAALGFNTLYLNVFLNGRPAFETTALPARSPDDTRTLARAIAAGKTHGIAVWAALDLLRWRSDLASKTPEPLPAGFVEDLSLLEETGSETVKRRLADDSFENRWVADTYYRYNPGSEGWVSPLDPRVQETLTRLVQDVARTEGLAGIAFQHTTMSGYIALDYYYGLENIEHGYLPDERLAFLRTGGGDPIDLGSLRWTGQSFSAGGDWINLTVTVPGYDDQDGTARVKPWQTYRVEASRALMYRLFAAVRAVAPSLPLALRERTTQQTFEPWTEAKALNEVTNLNADNDTMGKRANPRTIVVVPVSGRTLRDGKQLQNAIRSYRKDLGRGRSQGIVLDLTGARTNPVAELQALQPHFSPRGTPF